MRDDFFKSYLEFLGKNESPAIYDRWSVMCGIGAMLGRNFYIPHGMKFIYTNMYVMLMGVSGVRKSTAIKTITKIMSRAGYDNFAADKTSGEKFLMDFAGAGVNDTNSKGDIEDISLFGDDVGLMEDRLCMVSADEFNDFVGYNNMSFISVLGTLWDKAEGYKHRLKNSACIYIHNPTLTILGGNTPSNFRLAFPPESLGQGFFSRLLLIHSKPNDKSVAFPKSPTDNDKDEIARKLVAIQTKAVGCVQLSNTCKALLTDLYEVWQPIADVRFDSYSSRRFDHLLKLVLICTAMRYSNVVTEEDIVYANTVLSHAEKFMPSALGEFGKARDSDVADKVMTVIHAKALDGGAGMAALWENVSQDINTQQQLVDILVKLKSAGKIQLVKGGRYLPNRVIREYDSSYYSKFICDDLLTDEERNMV